MAYTDEEIKSRPIASEEVERMILTVVAGERGRLADLVLEAAQMVSGSDTRTALTTLAKKIRRLD